jgi:hypothetical protein
MSNPNLNKAQLSPAVVDFKKFNEMMGRRGMGTQHVSVTNPETSPEARTNPKVQKDREKITEAKAGAIGPFTVKIKHDDGYEDEVTSDSHSMAMDKAALTVTDNYAPDLTDYKAHTDEQAAKVQKVKDDGDKHAGFEESLRPQVEKLLDEHVKTWADRRAKLIGVINTHTGLNLGPLDNVQTREVHNALIKHYENEIASGRSNLHPVRDAYTEITGKSAPAKQGESPGGLFLTLNKGSNGLVIRGGDTLSGAPDFREHEIPVGKEEEKEQGPYVVEDWKKRIPVLQESREKWKNAITKGTRHDGYGSFDKDDVVNDLSKRGSKKGGREGFSLSLGIKNPYPEPEWHDATDDRKPVLPKYSRRTAPKTSTYEMYDSTGKKLHSGTISTDYDTGRDEKGEPTGDIYSTTKRFSARIEPH